MNITFAKLTDKVYMIVVSDELSFDDIGFKNRKTLRDLNLIFNEEYRALTDRYVCSMYRLESFGDNQITDENLQLLKQMLLEVQKIN